MSVEAMRLKWPMISWGGPQFTPAVGAPTNLWAGGAMVSPVNEVAGLGGFATFLSGGGTKLGFSASALFEWTDTFTTEPRDSAWVVPFTGLTPGDQFALDFSAEWVVDTVPEVGYLQVSVAGETTKTYRIPPGTSPLFWGKPFPRSDPYMAVTVPPSGTVTVTVYAWAHPSFFKTINFGQIIPGQAGVGFRQYKLLCPFYPEDFRIYSEPSPDYTELEYVSGVRDGWDVAGPFRKLAFTPRAIPWYGRDVPNDTWWGWDGEGGWRAFMQSFADGDPFDFYPDQDDLSVSYTMFGESPREARMDGDWVWHKRQRFVARTADKTTPVTGY